MAAVSQVFGVTELVEGILLNLSPKDLLFALNTSRYFQNVVAGSDELKRALWLLQESETRVMSVLPFYDYPAYLSGPAWKTWSDAEKKAAIDRFREPQEGLRAIERGSMSGPDNVWTTHPYSELSIDTTLNPFFTHLFAENFENYSADDEFPFNRALERTPGIWRAMFVTSPPASELVVEVADNAEYCEKLVLKDPAGIKMGDILDAILYDTEEDIFWIQIQGFWELKRFQA